MELPNSIKIRLHRPVKEKDILKAKSFAGVKNAIINEDNIIIESDGSKYFNPDEITLYFKKYGKWM